MHGCARRKCMIVAGMPWRAVGCSGWLCMRTAAKGSGILRNLVGRPSRFLQRLAMRNLRFLQPFLPSLSKACQPCTSTKRSPSPNPGSRPWRPGHPPSRASPLDTPIVPTAATPLTLTPQFVEARQRRAHLPRTLPTAMAVSPSRSADPESQTEMHTVTVKTSVQWQVLSRPLVRGFALALTLALALPPSHPPPPPRPRPNPHLPPRPPPPLALTPTFTLALVLPLTHTPDRT